MGTPAAGAWPEAEAELVVYPARLVRTLDPARPVAQAVAVQGDRIRAVGTLDELAAYGPARVDDRYAGRVLLPGFVEAHSHASGGGLWRFPYLGYLDRVDPDGRSWPGCRTVADVLARLREAERRPGRSRRAARRLGDGPDLLPGRAARGPPPGRDLRAPAHLHPAPELPPRHGEHGADAARRHHPRHRRAGRAQGRPRRAGRGAGRVGRHGPGHERPRAARGRPRRRDPRAASPATPATRASPPRSTSGTPT